MRSRSAFALILAVAVAAVLTLVFAQLSGVATPASSTSPAISSTFAPRDQVQEAISALLARGTVTSCHFEYHEAGHRLGAAGAGMRDVSRVEGFDGCNWGLVHGVVEGRLAAVTAETFAQQVAELCDVQDSELRGNCEHGAGHVALTVAASDVLGALELCDSQAEGRDSCADGVMMAFGNAVGSDESAQEQAWGLCEQLNGSYQEKCDLYSGFLWWKKAAGDVNALLAHCRDDSENCGIGVGRAVAMHAGTAAEAGGQCAGAADPAVRSGCAFGVGEQLALLRRTGQSEEAVWEVCADVPKELAAACRQGAGL